MSVTPAEPRKPRAEAHVPELDGVRGLAIAMVMALHFLCSLIDHPTNLIERVTSKLTGYGNWGVDLFFVLSGYLITGILWDTRGTQNYFLNFYMRRTLRIFPLYYGVLFLILVLVPQSVFATYLPDALQIRAVQAWLWPYLTNVYIAKQGDFSIPYVSHFWTLAIEEHFYLFWPFIVGSLDRRAVMRVAVALSVFALGLRVVLLYVAPNPFYAHVLTPCRLDSLCVGSWFALAVRSQEGMDALGPKLSRWLGLTAAGVLLTSGWHAVIHSAEEIVGPVRDSFLALFFACFIALAAWRGGPPLLKSALRAKLLGSLGKYSYSLYVFHGILAYWMGKHRSYVWMTELVGSRTLAFFVQAALGVAASVLISIASYEIYEVRFLKLKKWFQAGFGSRNLPASAAPSAVPRE